MRRVLVLAATYLALMAGAAWSQEYHLIDIGGGLDEGIIGPGVHQAEEHPADAPYEEFFRTCWGMLAERGAWTWWETFHGGSRCHAWSSCPTHYLSSRVLGVGFPEPGNPDVVCLEPHPGTLQWAAGFYPHPRGRIWVEWERKAGDVLLSYEAPPGVDITVKGAIVND